MVNKTKKFDPTDREILRVLSKAKLRATPSKIANAINIHPSTAKSRVEKLSNMGLVDLKLRGNRTLAKANNDAIRKALGSKRKGLVK